MRTKNVLLNVEISIPEGDYCIHGGESCNYYNGDTFHGPSCVWGFRGQKPVPHIGILKSKYCAALPEAT